MKKLCFVIALMMMTSVSYGLPGTKQYRAVWTANTEPDLAGYYLYWRTSSGSFSDANRVQIAKTATSQLLTGVVPNNTIIALTAYDTAGNESGFSNEVPFDKDTVAPAAPSGLAIQ